MTWIYGLFILKRRKCNSRRNFFLYYSTLHHIQYLFVAVCMCPDELWTLAQSILSVFHFNVIFYQCKNFSYMPLLEQENFCSSFMQKWNEQAETNVHRNDFYCMLNLKFLYLFTWITFLEGFCDIFLHKKKNWSIINVHAFFY